MAFFLFSCSQENEIELCFDNTLDFESKFKDCRVRAEQGDAIAQYNLAKLYGNGQGVPLDYEQSVLWTKRAVEQGYAKAEFSLGKLYYWGAIVPKDMKKAFEWIKKSAEQGYVVAQCFLGKEYHYGFTVPKDYKEAIRWYREAIEQGMPEAQFELGLMYFNGKGVPQDYTEGFRWIEEAAIQGYSSAQNKLGSMYFGGEGVPQDYKEAFLWFTKVTEQGTVLSKYSQYKLGMMHADGQGVPQDFVKAYMYFNISSANGYDYARKLRDEYAEKMAASQIAESQKLAREWSEQHKTHELAREWFEQRETPKKRTSSGSTNTDVVENTKNIPADILKSESYLGTMSNEFNKTLPKMVDKHIELATTIGQSSHYTLVYRTVNFTSEQVKEMGLIKGIKPETITHSCTDPVFRKFLDAGVLITAQYIAKDSEYIGEIDITKDDCY